MTVSAQLAAERAANLARATGSDSACASVLSRLMAMWRLSPNELGQAQAKLALECADERRALLFRIAELEARVEVLATDRDML